MMPRCENSLLRIWPWVRPAYKSFKANSISTVQGGDYSIHGVWGRAAIRCLHTRRI